MMPTTQAQHRQSTLYLGLTLVRDVLMEFKAWALEFATWLTVASLGSYCMSVSVPCFLHL